MARTVKTIKMAGRDCIMTEFHCIPIDMITRVKWVPDTTPEGAKIDAEFTEAVIYTASETKGIALPKEEAQQLKKMLNIG